MKEYKTILVEKKWPVGKIIYNVPEKRNPLTIEMVDEATDAFIDRYKRRNCSLLALWRFKH